MTDSTPHRRAKQHFVSVCCYVCLGLALHEEASANSGDRIVLPKFNLFTQSATPAFQNAAPNSGKTIYSKSGLQVLVDTTGVGARGYRLVKVTVTSQQVATADRQMTIRFHARSSHRGQEVISVEKDFELREGEKSVEVMLRVPQFVNWNRVGWEFWVDGLKDELLSTDYERFSSSQGGIEIHSLRFDRAGGWANVNQSTYAGSIQMHTGFLSEWPESWTDYCSVDLVTLGLDDLESLEKFSATQPQAKRALLQWVRAGGNLWVLQGGARYNSLPLLDDFLEPDQPDAVDPLWHAVPLEGPQTVGIEGLLRLQATEAPMVAFLDPGNKQITRSSQSDSYPWCIVRAYGLGTITVFQNSLNAEEGEAVRKTMVNERVHWTRRHGTDPGNANFDFNNFFIGDVGLAPVTEFQILITLFVLGIGPLNYWLLRRQGKLPMLLATVPASALATIVFLFAYGYLSEGVGTKVRARSLAILDQENSEIASWARLSYYAGIAPRQGLTFPDDTLTYPILPASQNRRMVRRYANQSRELLYESNDIARLSQGWLPSRTPVQYLSMTARATKKKVDLELLPKGLRVTNRLGSDLIFLAIRDDLGKYYLCDALPVGESLLLHPSKKGKVMADIRELFTDSEPQFPVGGDLMSTSARNSLAALGAGSRSSFSTSLMETHLAAIMSPSSGEWAKRSYVAITQQGIAVELGLENIDQQDSFHVVRGSW